MELTDRQIEAVYLLIEEGSLQEGDNRVNKRTINSLELKGVVKWSRYANGYFWELTDKGLSLYKITR